MNRPKPGRLPALLALLPLLGLGLAWGLWQLSKAESFQICGRLVDRVETELPLVALTFDDGPAAAFLEPVLATLRAHGARATFFVTGHEVEQHPALARRLLAEGHELGNHSYSHARLLLRSPGFVASEIARTDRALRAVGQRKQPWFRPPYGAKLLVLPLHLRRTQRTTVMWDAAADDDLRLTAPEIAARALDQVRPGSIVLMHVMYESREASRDALPLLLDGLAARGLRPVSVGELMRVAGDDG